MGDATASPPGPAAIAAAVAAWSKVPQGPQCTVIKLRPPFHPLTFWCFLCDIMSDECLYTNQ